jgi:hypothetical protein
VGGQVQEQPARHAVVAPGCPLGGQRLAGECQFFFIIHIERNVTDIAYIFNFFWQ